MNDEDTDAITFEVNDIDKYGQDQEQEFAFRGTGLNTKSLQKKVTSQKLVDDVSVHSEEDDINTIASDTTSVYNNKHSDKDVPPVFVRYQFMANLDKVDMDNLLRGNDELIKNADNLTDSARYREVFIHLTQYLKSLDPNASFVSWKNEKQFTVHSLSDTFPTDVVTISKYFDGFKSTLKAGRNYFRFCLHSPAYSQQWIESNMSQWAALHSYIIYKCIIQAENSKSI